jgi:hypothetical protein
MEKIADFVKAEQKADLYRLLALIALIAAKDKP